jgi:hypothetical protein
VPSWNYGRPAHPDTKRNRIESDVSDRGMLAGIAMSTRSLVAEFTQLLVEGGESLRKAVSNACRVRLRAIHMTSLATITSWGAKGLREGESKKYNRLPGRVRVRFRRHVPSLPTAQLRAPNLFPCFLQRARGPLDRNGRKL